LRNLKSQKRVCAEKKQRDIAPTTIFKPPLQDLLKRGRERVKTGERKAAIKPTPAAPPTHANCGRTATTAVVNTYRRRAKRTAPARQPADSWMLAVNALMSEQLDCTSCGDLSPGIKARGPARRQGGPTHPVRITPSVRAATQSPRGHRASAPRRVGKRLVGHCPVVDDCALIAMLLAR
jgi:hypothetical protein